MKAAAARATARCWMPLCVRTHGRDPYCGASVPRPLTGPQDKEVIPMLRMICLHLCAAGVSISC